MSDIIMLLHAAIAEIERLRAEVRHIRIDNARLRDEATPSALTAGKRETPS